MIPQTPKAVPRESSIHPPPEGLECEPGAPLPADSDVELDAPEEPIFSLGGHRIVRNYKSSRRPEGIDSELWKML